MICRAATGWTQRRMPAEGIEPTRSCDHWILSPARLPVPPRRRERRAEKYGLAQTLQAFARDRPVDPIVWRTFLAAEFKCGDEDRRPTDSGRPDRAAASFAAARKSRAR